MTDEPVAVAVSEETGREVELHDDAVVRAFRNFRDYRVRTAVADGSGPDTLLGHEPAHALGLIHNAGHALDRDDWERARRTVQQALAVLPREDPARRLLRDGCCDARPRDPQFGDAVRRAEDELAARQDHEIVTDGGEETDAYPCDMCGDGPRNNRTRDGHPDGVIKLVCDDCLDLNDDDELVPDGGTVEPTDGLQFVDVDGLVRDRANIVGETTPKDDDTRVTVVDSLALLAWVRLVRMRHGSRTNVEICLREPDEDAETDHPALFARHPDRETVLGLAPIKDDGGETTVAGEGRGEPE